MAGGEMAVGFWWPFAVLLIIAGAALTAVRRRYLVVTVRGSSMCPTYRDADRVLVRLVRGSSSRDPRRGQVIVLRPPVEELRLLSPLLVKRVAAVPGDAVPADFSQVVPLPVVPPRRLLVRGDNEGSADSRSFGLVDFELVVGVALRSGRPPAS